VNTNWMIWRGLRRHGYDDLAATLAGRTVDMVVKSGMREFYNPLNGDGLGATSFGWSALALDMLDG
jgi:glycogen debranching enzyme